MPKKSMRRSRSRRAGSWTDPSSWSNPFASKDKDPNVPPPPAYAPPATSSGMGYTPPPATSSGMGYTPPPTTNSGRGYGGKKGKRRRSMRGGDFSANTPTTGLASTAASVGGVPTASAQYVGGRTRHHRHNKSCKISCRRHHRHTKSCKHRKH